MGYDSPKQECRVFPIEVMSFETHLVGSVGAVTGDTAKHPARQQQLENASTAMRGHTTLYTRNIRNILGKWSGREGASA